jgi:hypothetical protein
MSVIGKVRSYDLIRYNRSKQANAAAVAAARSSSRQTAAQNTLAKSDNLRNTMASTITQGVADQSQLTSQLIRTRMATEAKAKAESDKWYS